MKKFIMCVMICIILQAEGLPKAQANIDYKSRYEISYKYKQKKSIRKIIREILNRKKIDRVPPAKFPEELKPYLYKKSHEGFHKEIKPLYYDSIDSERLRRLA